MNGDHVLFVTPDGYNFDYWESPYCIPSPDASQVLCGFAQVWTPITTQQSVGECQGQATIDLNNLTAGEGNWYTAYRVTSDGPGMGALSVVVTWHGALGGFPGIVFDDFGPNDPYFTDRYEPAGTVELGPSGAIVVADLGAAVLLQDGTECSLDAAGAGQVF